MYVAGMTSAKPGKSERRKPSRPRLGLAFGLPIFMMTLFSLVPGAVVVLRLCTVGCEPMTLYWIGYLGLGADIVALIWYAICLIKLPLNKGQRLIAAAGGLLALLIFAVVLRLGIW
jgi:hypothetical protein